MKVATFMSLFPSFPETYVLWHISELVRSGQDVTLYADQFDPKPKKLQPEVTELDLMSLVQSAPQLGQALGEKIPRALDALARALARHPSQLARALLMLNDAGGLGLTQVVRHLAWLDVPVKYDALHAYFGTPGRAAAMLRDVGAVKGPLVTSFLGFDVTLLPLKVPHDYYRRLFDRAECLTVSSKYMRKLLLELGAPERKTRVLPLGMPLERFEFKARRRQDGEPLRLMTAARLSKIKGLDWGLRAVALAVKQGVDVRWDIYGDGGQREPLQALCAELKLERHVTFHGFKPMPEVRQGMARAHLALFPGVRTERGSEEALGGAVLEAQGSGMPVIATDAGGISEGLIPGVSGLVVPQRDAEALAEAIVKMEADEARWPEMGAAGRAHIREHFDCARLNDKWLELYRSL